MTEPKYGERVSVDHRLPPAHDSVLVWLPGGWFLGVWNSAEWYAYLVGGLQRCPTPTHWTPLPPGPGEPNA